MKKQLKLGKNSFTLFETILSIFLLSIIIVGFSQSSTYDNFDKEYMLLNEIENSFTTKNYNSNFSTTSKYIKIIINSNNEENLHINEIKYKDNKIELIKYEIL